MFVPLLELTANQGAVFIPTSQCGPRLPVAPTLESVSSCVPFPPLDVTVNQSLVEGARCFTAAHPAPGSKHGQSLHLCPLGQ